MRRERYNGRQRAEFAKASEFYASKLESAPENARYNHFQAILKHTAGQDEAATYHYKQTVTAKPHDVMARNDFALHLAKQGFIGEAEDELQRALLLQRDQPTLHKNLAAVQSRHGQYSQALEHALRAVQLNPYDAMNHRNLAKLRDAVGDNRSALEHNLRSISLEKDMLRTRGGAAPNTNAIRQAAVQMVTKGTGDFDEAIAFMNAARKIERKTFSLPTSSRTYEIISKVNALKGNKEAEMEKEKIAEAEKQKSLNDMKQGIMPGMLDHFKKDLVEEHD